MELVPNEEKLSVRNPLNNLTCRAQPHRVIFLRLETGEHTDDRLPVSQSKLLPDPVGIGWLEALNVRSIVNNPIAAHLATIQLAVECCSCGRVGDRQITKALRRFESNKVASL